MDAVQYQVFMVLYSIHAQEHFALRFLHIIYFFKQVAQYWKRSSSNQAIFKSAWFTQVGLY